MSLNNSFIYGDFNITTSFSDGYIYILLVNNVTFQRYEDNIECSDIEAPFYHEEKYGIICECFQKKPNYEANFDFDINKLKIIFTVLINGSYTLKFNIIVKEKILNKDSQNALYISKLEIKYKEDIKRLETKHEEDIKILNEKIMKLEFIIDKISTQLEETQNKLNITILEDKRTENIKKLSIRDLDDKIMKLENIIGNIPIDIRNQNQNYLSLNSTEFIENSSKINYKLFKSFYCLKKIKLNDLYAMSNGNNNTNIVFENSTVEILIFAIHSFNANISSITSLEGLQNLPSVHTLEFHNCIRLTESHNIIPFLHKNIKKISFFNCGTTTKGFLSKYCLDNDIELNYI